MRNLLLTLLAVCLTTLTFADIIRVNNNSGISADFSSLQQAIDSANVGDTIYLEPSSTNYGNITLNKRLSIYGPGYFLAQNTGLQANINASTVNRLTINGAAAFSSVSGIRIAEYIDLYVGNIAITRCRFISTGTCFFFSGSTPNTNVLIAQNYIRGSISNSSGTQTYTVFFRNNYFGSTSFTVDPSIICDFTNNIIRYYSWSITNSVFVNNIFLSGNVPNISTSTNGFENNIFQSNFAADTSLGNISGVNTATLFTGGTTDGQYQIVPGSLADDGGKEIPTGTPTDCGMFGGPNPYKLSGVPAIPTIYDLVVPTSNTTGGLNVTIKARSQD